MVSTIITGKHTLRQWHEEGNDQFRLRESKPSQEEVILKLETNRNKGEQYSVKSMCNLATA